MRALLTLGLIGAIGYMTNGTAEPVETATPSEQIEVHSVVVDQPQVQALPQGSGEIWDLLESSGQLVETVPANRVEHGAFDLLEVSSVASIRSHPFPSAEIVGIAPAGAFVQAAARYSEWVLIIDPWSRETGWIHSKRLAPYATSSTPLGAGLSDGAARSRHSRYPDPLARGEATIIRYFVLQAQRQPPTPWVQVLRLQGIWRYP